MPGQFQGSGLRVSPLLCCCGQTGLQQEHLPWGEGKKGQECFETGRFLSNWTRVSLEEVNKLLVMYF